MTDQPSISGYRYPDDQHSCAHGYLLPTVLRELAGVRSGLGTSPARCFDLGCGNGSFAAALTKEGWAMTGVDPSAEGIAAAKLAYPHLRLELGSTQDDLAALYGRFPVVISLEVVEHVYAPREYARKLFDLVEPGGTAVISTPYHGYVKNLALALTGKMDAHFTALWDNGHIKFWSISTLSKLLREAGFTALRFHRVGRYRLLAKSMIAIAMRPKRPTSE